MAKPIKRLRPASAAAREERRKRWEQEARAASWWRIAEARLKNGASLEDAAKIADAALELYDARFPGVMLPER